MLLKKLKQLPIPAELKVEFYEKKHQAAVFDRVDQSLLLVPGKNVEGAIVRGFVDAIRKHDELVKIIEDKLRAIDDIKREYKKKARLFRNFDNAWTAMYDPVFEEYLELKPTMLNIDEVLNNSKDPAQKTRLEVEWNRFLEIEPRCSNLEVVRDALEAAKAVRDEWTTKVLAAEQELNVLKEEERLAASGISDDHIVADERGQSLAEMFPNVKEGMILTKINDYDVQNESFGNVMETIKYAKYPHKVEFTRYDYRLEPFTHQWHSLEELRSMDVAVDQPMIPICDFVRMAGSGDLAGIKAALQRGDNPDNTDHTGIAAMHVAAANDQFDVVQLLLQAGAQLDPRDKNMMTPLLYAVRKGHVDMARQLMELGAERDATDKNGRGVLFDAVSNGAENIVRVFLRKENRNRGDVLWGYAPLHLAALHGNIRMLKFLLGFGCSVYVRSKNGLTPEQVAEEAAQKTAKNLLEQERLQAPAQLVHSDRSIEVDVWIGDHAALDPEWNAQIGVTNVVLLMPSDMKPTANMGWMRVAGQRSNDPMLLLPKHFLCYVDVDDDDATERSWKSLAVYFKELMEFCMNIMKKGSATLLVVDPTGDSTAPAVVACLMLLRSQIRTTETVVKCIAARPSVQLSQSMRKGIAALQTAMDQKRLDRLNHKLRHTDILMNDF